MNIPQDKLNSLLLDLLVDTNIQLSALKDLVFTEYINQTNESAEEIMDAFAKQYEYRKIELLNRLTTHYSDQNIDDLLKDILD